MGARRGAREHANSRIRGYSALWAEQRIRAGLVFLLVFWVLAGACQRHGVGVFFIVQFFFFFFTQYVLYVSLLLTKLLKKVNSNSRVVKKWNSLELTRVS